MISANAAIARMQTFFSSWRFPALMLSVLLTFKALVVLMLFAPIGPTGFGQFAEEFKVWCFGLDPATGHMQTMYVVLAIVEPLVLGGIIAGVWWRPLGDVLRARPRAVVPYMAFAALLVGVGAASLFGARTANAADLPFPAAALRTQHRAPAVQLQNQDGEAVSLEQLHGRVVLLTGVYASCGYTCPMILGQAKRSLAALTEPERRGVTVLAVTLNPEHDGQAELAEMARAQGVRAPSFNLLWGAPKEVNGILDDLSIARTKNPETGAIDHANLFVLLDRRGAIAYRLTLGAQQEKWLVEALRTLLREPAPGS